MPSNYYWFFGSYYFPSKKIFWHLGSFYTPCCTPPSRNVLFPHPRYYPTVMRMVLDGMIDSVFIYLTWSLVFEYFYLQSPSVHSFIMCSGEKLSLPTYFSQASLEDVFCSGNTCVRISNNILYVVSIVQITSASTDFHIDL